MAELKSMHQVEPPYFPFKGVNVDSNGLAIAADECVMCKNFDITATEVQLRPGTISLTPSGNPLNPAPVEGQGLPEEDVLHYEEFKHPNGTKLLFAFTDRDIYFYTTDGGWRTCIDIDLFEGHTFNNWSTTQIVDKTLGATVLAAGSYIAPSSEVMEKGAERLLCYFDQTDGLWYKFDMKIQTPVVEETTGLKYPAANAASLSFQGMNLEILDTSKWKVLSPTEIKVSIASNTSGALIPTISVSMKDENGDPTDDITLAVEAAITVSGSSGTSSSTTALDCDVALSGDAIVKQILSVTSSSYNVKLTDQVAIYFETAVSGIVTAGSALEATTNPAFIEVVPKTFFISLGTGEGSIAQAGTVVESLPVGKAALGDASDGANVDCYRLIPTNFEIAAYDEDCYVRVDGKEWQIKILRPVYAGASLLVNYDYYETSSYKPAYIATHRNALLLGNTYEEDLQYYPWRLRWSEAGDVSLIKYYSYQDFLQRKLSPIVAVATLNTIINNEASGFLYVFQSDYVYRGVPHSELFLNFEVAYLEGVLSPRTIVEADGMFFYLADNDIYAFDGVERKSITKDEKTGHTRVRNYIYSNLDYGALEKNFAVYDRGRRKIWFFLKFLNNQGTYPKDVAVYDLDSRMWYFYDIPETSTAMCAKIVSATTPISALRGNIEDLVGSIEDLSETLPYTDRVIAAMTKETFGFAGGAYYDKIKPDSQEDIVAYLLTRDFIGQYLEFQDRTQRVQIEAKGEKMTVGWDGTYSLDPEAMQNQEDFILNNQYQLRSYNPDVTHYHIKFMLKTISKPLYFRWLQVYRIRQELTND